MNDTKRILQCASAALFSVGLLCSAVLADSAQTTLPPGPQNFNFEASANADGVPQQWNTSDEPALYALDTKIKHGGEQSLRIVGKRGTWTTLTSRIFQRISAENYRGKRARFSVWAKTEDIDPASSIWIAVFDNNDVFLKSDALIGDPSRAITGTSDWKQHTVEIDIPQNAFRISLGFEMASRGTAWVDDMTLE